MTTFESFMEEIRDELLEKINKLKQQERDKRKNENLHLMTCERDFYKQEAVRLNMICKQLNENLEKSVKEKKNLILDNKNMNEKWKESEKINKHLLLELECKIQENIDLENENNTIKKELENKTNSNANLNLSNNVVLNLNNGFENKTNTSNFFPKLGTTQYSKNSKISNNHLKSNNVNPNMNVNQNVNAMNYTSYTKTNERKNKWISNNIETSNSPNKEEFHKTIYRDNSIENLKGQNMKLITEKNKYLTCLKTISKNKFEKNRLENIFHDCVESVRNDIKKRKENAGFSKNEIKKGLILDEKLDREINDIKNAKCSKEENKFLIKDKYALLEKFILDEEVLNKLRDLIFNEKKMMDTNGFSAFRNTNYTNNSDVNPKNQTTSNFGQSFNNTAINFNNQNEIVNANSTQNKFHNLTRTDRFDHSKLNKFDREKNSKNSTTNEFFRKFKSATKTFYNKKHLRLEKIMPMFPF